MKEKFTALYPKDYAEEINKAFEKDPSLWFGVIIPKEKAEQLKRETKCDYSLIWHEHCSRCWKNIDKETDELCYVSEDKLTWLCSECFKVK